jgi:hypothetical protein
VDRSKWQRRWRRQGPSEIVGRCYRIQKCICSVLGDDSIWHAESGEYVTRFVVARHVLSINRSLTVRRNAIRLGGYPGKPPSRSTPCNSWGTKVPFNGCDMTGSRRNVGWARV